MPLYSYKKAPVKYRKPRSAGEEPEEVVIKIKSETPPLTVWDLLAGLFHDVHRLLIKSRVAGLLVPLILIVIGGNIIYREVWPEIEQQVKLALGYYDVTTVALVAGDYVERAKFLSNPGSQYFAELNEDADAASILQKDPVSAVYKSTFSMSIPSLELTDLPVGANVNSGIKEVYDEVLSKGLAHFEGTGLPISDVKNNMVVYGHSSSGDYYERTRDVAGSFSRLNKIKIGDEIIVNIDGTRYKYRVFKSKIVKPEDISIVTGTYNKKTLTLFTCFPNGNSANRFVAIARPVD